MHRSIHGLPDSSPNPTPAACNDARQPPGVDLDTSRRTGRDPNEVLCDDSPAGDVRQPAEEHARLETVI
jgi:hypothetical protein